MSTGQATAVARPLPARVSRLARRRDSAAPAHYHPLMLALGATCAGIVADRQAWPIAPHSFELWWLLAALALVGWFIAWRRGRLVVAMAALAMALAAVGGAWHHARWNLYADDELGRFAQQMPQPTCIEALAVSAPRDAPSRPNPMQVIPQGPPTRLTVEALAIRDGARWQSASGRMQLSVEGKLTSVQVGDRLRIFGQLAAFNQPGNPGEFDFARHARADRQLSALRAEAPECVTVTQRGSAWNPSRWLEWLRARGEATLQRYISADYLGLADGLLLGRREQIDRDTNDAFLRTGTVHILSISGLHVAILAWLLLVAFRTGWMSRGKALAWVVAITGGYMLLTGAEPPVVRATVLVWIICGALWLGRAGLALNSLALAALLALAINPNDLFRIGVQLSFLSAGVLMWATPRLSRWPAQDSLDRLIAGARPWPARMTHRLARNTARLFLVGALIWVVVTPLTMAQFHLLSPVGLLLNVILAPLVTLAMVTGFGLLAVGWLLPPLGAVLGWLCDVSLGLMQRTVEAASNLPGAFVWTPAPPISWLTVFYLAAGAAVALPLVLRRFTLPLRWRVALVGGWCGVGLLTMLPPSAGAHSLRCTFVSVGHGCAVVVELPDGKTLLYDAGRQGSPTAGSRSISATLWSRGITHLDAVVISHADADHYNALPDVLERFSAGVVYVGPQMFQDPSRALAALRASIEQAGAPIQYVVAGDRLCAGDGATIEVLHPPPQGVEGTDNAGSIVLRIEYQGRRILLTGDLESPGLEMLTDGPPCDCDVLLAPHHGSARSDPPGFAAWSTPDWVVISGGQRSSSELVRTAYESQGATVLNTAECGAVTIVVDSRGIDVQPFRAARHW